MSVLGHVCHRSFLIGHVCPSSCLIGHVCLWSSLLSGDVFLVVFITYVNVFVSAFGCQVIFIWFLSVNCLLNFGPMCPGSSSDCQKCEEVAILVKFVLVVNCHLYMIITILVVSPCTQIWR